MKHQIVVAVCLSLVACHPTPSNPEASPTVSVASGADAPPSASPTSAPPPEPAETGMKKLAEVEAEVRASIPAGAGDYARAVALAKLYADDDITFDELQAAILALKLPPHSLGDGYLMLVAPPPPPGIAFDPKNMPKDWEGTWGEVAMGYFLGHLDKATYDKLHRAAHPSCKL